MLGATAGTCGRPCCRELICAKEPDGDSTFRQAAVTIGCLNRQHQRDKLISPRAAGRRSVFSRGFDVLSPCTFSSVQRRAHVRVCYTHAAEPAVSTCPAALLPGSPRELTWGPVARLQGTPIGRKDHAPRLTVPGHGRPDPHSAAEAGTQPLDTWFQGRRGAWVHGPARGTL